MAAANTDLLKKKRSNFSTTLNGAIGSGDATIALNSTSGLPVDTAVLLTIDRVDSNGNSTPSLRERVIGVVSGNNLTTCLRGQDNTSVASHASGAVVEDIWDAMSWNDALKAVLVEHNQDGTHNINPKAIGSPVYAADAGTANAYAVTLSPALAAYAAGNIVRFKAANSNTTTSTLNINGLGAKTIKKLDGATNLASGDIQAGQLVVCGYDGTNFQMITPIGQAVSNNVTEANITLSDVTTDNVSTSAHGFTPKAPNNTYQFLRADATYGIPQSDGWITDTHTWVYVSASSFKITGVDLTAQFTKGTRVKLTNNSTTYYGVVLSSAFSTDTTVTLAANNDYSLANSAITNPFYSYQVSPQGYPTYFNYTPTYSGGGSMTWTGVTTNVAKFAVIGNMMFILLDAIGTTGGSAANELIATIPANAGTANSYRGACAVGDTSMIGGVYYVTSAGAIHAQRYDAANFGLGANHELFASIVYQF